MADISKIKLPGDNTEYNIKDATARAVTDTFNVITLTGTSGTLSTTLYASLNEHTIIRWHATSSSRIVLYCANPKVTEEGYSYRGFSSDDAVITITITKSTRAWAKATTTLSTSGHTHNALDITSGTMAPERLDIAKNLNLWSIGNGYISDTEYGGTWYDFGEENDGYQPIEANTTYTISYDVTKQQFIKYYDSSKTFISDSGQFTASSKTFTTPSNCTFIKVVCVGRSDNVEIMLNKGSSALAYMPYVLNKDPEWDEIKDKPNVMMKSFYLTRNSASDNYSINFSNYLSGFTGSFIMILAESQGNCTGIWAMSSTSWNYNRQDFDGAQAKALANVQNYNSPRTYLTVTINSGSGNVTISGGKATKLQVTLIGNNPFA